MLSPRGSTGLFSRRMQPLDHSQRLLPQTSGKSRAAAALGSSVGILVRNNYVNLYKTACKGTHWIPVLPTTTNQQSDRSIFGLDTMYSSNISALLRSDNRTNTWTTLPRIAALDKYCTTGSHTKPVCRSKDCDRPVRRRGFCFRHGAKYLCKAPGCTKCAHTGGRCVTHGGGTRCSVANCVKVVQAFGKCCSHGGKRLCIIPECPKVVKTPYGYCLKHKNGLLPVDR